MTITPIIAGGLGGTISALLFVAYARKRRLRLLEGSKWGANFSDVKCPSCGTPLPFTRIPKSFRQLMWGGWTCTTCGNEFDKWLRPVSGNAENVP
jgi:hypothetical protein